MPQIYYIWPVEPEKVYIEKMPVVGWVLLASLTACVLIMGYKISRLEHAQDPAANAVAKLREQEAQFTLDSTVLVSALAESRKREDSLIRESHLINQRNNEKIRYIFDSIPATDIDGVFSSTFDSLAIYRFGRYATKKDSSGHGAGNVPAR